MNEKYPKLIGEGEYLGCKFKVYQFDDSIYKGWIWGWGVSEEEFPCIARCHLDCLGRIRSTEEMKAELRYQFIKGV